jgi:hypothetical protein
MARDSAKNIPYGIHGMEGGIHPFHMESIWNIPGSVKTSLSEEGGISSNAAEGLDKDKVAIIQGIGGDLVVI